jgi:hypothetical protein
MVFSACVKDKPNNPIQPQIQLSTSKKVYVINEGPFQTGNGSVSLYDVASGVVIENYYKSQNNEDLGNVAQSVSYFNNNFYIVVNNAHKIIVCDNQFKKTGQILELVSPRYILPVTNQKAYVSDLYANAISVIDLNQQKKIASIPCAGKTEKMVLMYNKVFVSNSDKKYVYVINTINDVIIDSVFVGLNASSLVIDKQDKIWVLSSGETANSKGRLSKLNSTTHEVETFWEFPASDSPYNICINKTKDTLYYLNNGVFRMSVTSVNLPSFPLIDKGNKNFYGLGLNQNDYTIYVADALDYVQKSNIYIYDANGNQKTSFKAGIISNGFYFE